MEGTHNASCDARLNTTLQALVQEKAIGARDSPVSAFVWDVDVLDRTITATKAFPESFVHCYALKAGKSKVVLDAINRHGLGMEGASIEEVRIALKSGCPPEKVLFDSPAKTYRDLEESMGYGVVINANSVAELDRIEEVRATMDSNSVVGLRINPLVGRGLTVEQISVAVAGSKFGVHFTEETEQSVVDEFVKRPWLAGLHAHVGSGGIGLKALLGSVKTLVNLADKIDLACGEKRIQYIDIGGGLMPTNDGAPEDLFGDYLEALKPLAPSFFDNSRRIFTEFGRALVLNSGFAVSPVEYALPPVPIEDDQTLHTLITHLGAHTNLRECYVPKNFKIKMSTHNSDGTRKGEDEEKVLCQVAGPLCFAGDLLAKRIDLPLTNAGDLLVIHNCGGYGLGMFSDYCSPARPACYSVTYDADGSVSITRDE